MTSSAKSTAEWTVRDNPESRRFEIDLGDALAVAEYTLPKGMIMFTHTEVPSQHEGKHVGTALIRAGLAAARERSFKVVPICPFFASYIRKHPEEQDLLMSPGAGRLGLTKVLWPNLPYEPWRETCSALHLYTQIVGKYRLARSPWVNHSWHATLYVHARGLTTSLIPDAPGGVEIVFDLLDHRLVGNASNGRSASFDLCPMSVAEFHTQFRELVQVLGGTPDFHGRPNEVPEPVAFADDDARRPYDRDAVTRFFHALVSMDRVFNQFRTGFVGKVSPVHLFWGSFDVAVTRFSGRRAPRHPGGIPSLPDEITREAYSHEVSSAGFWPGGGGADFPAFYSYAYPTPEGFAAAEVEPAAAYFDKKLGEFVLPYEAVRSSQDPEAMLMAFLQSTYSAAAELGNWDRAALESEVGAPGRPRQI